MSEAVDTLGKYQIRGELGRGAMGIVYRGFDPMIEREVAIKTLRADLLESGEKDTLLARFKKEAQAAGRLNHRGIVQVYEYGEDADRVFIAMELIQGRELKDYMSEQARFSTAEIVRMVKELLDALGYAHSHGVVHRDIKPSNVVLLPDGHIKITDFGIARLESSTLTQAGNVLGTPSYMSPEQFMGQRIDGRSDLFSTGVMLYELLTGEKPFIGNSFTTIMHKVMKESPSAPSSLNISLHPSFDQVLAVALAKRPDERFRNAAEFSQALDLALAGKPIAAPADEMTVMAAPAGHGSNDETVLADASATLAAAPRAPVPVDDQTVVRAPPPVSAPVATQAPAGTMATEAAPPEPGSKRWVLVVAAVAAIGLAGGAFLSLRSEAPPPAAAQATGSIMLESDPPGAVITIDNDRFMGVTPARLDLPPGMHQISLKKDRHHTLDSSVEITAGKTVPFQAVLTPLE